MTDNIIKCPNCGTEIEVGEALFAQVKDSIRDEIDGEYRDKYTELQKKMKSFEEQKATLAERQERIGEEIAEKLEVEKKRIADDEKKKAEEKLSLEIGDLRNQLKESKERLSESQKNELSLRKKERDLQDRIDNFELEVAKQLSKERDKIKKDALTSISEQHRLETADLKNQIKALTDQIDILKQKAEQGSQEAQGEVFELELEDLLREQFPDDSIVPVPKGISGADLIQEVMNSAGILCGKIIWESKRTKSWSDSWINKLKNDQRKIRADVAVIISTSMPRGVDDFELRDGIWITRFRNAVAIATSLRHGIIEIASARMASLGKGKKMDLLYAYLSGQDFRNRLEDMIEATASLKRDLDREKMAMTKIWAKREKQIEKVALNMVGMYGELHGMIGASLPEIKQIELKALPEK